MAKRERWRKAAKIEFTEILEDLNSIEADAAVTQQEGDIVDTNFAVPPLDDGLNEAEPARNYCRIEFGKYTEQQLREAV